MVSAAPRLVALAMRALAVVMLIVAVAAAPLPRPVAAETCCCPRPADCTCPDHHPGKGAPTSLRRCSQPVEQAASVPAPPALAATPAILLARPLPITTVIAVALPAPHAPPDLERPAGPS